MLIEGKSADQNVLHVLHSLRRIQPEGDGSNSFAVFFTGPEQHYSIQALGRSGVKDVWVECASNEFLAPKFALDSERIAPLLALGWNQPDSKKRPNFWRWLEARADIDLQVTARQVIQAFVQVYGFRLDRTLETELRLSTAYG
jgi:hypothetical protein